MSKRKDPVVASLSNRSPHPYSAIAMSPNREYAIVAGKDTIQLVKIDPSGLKSLRSLKISQYFQIGVASADGRPQVGKKHGDVRDTFARPGKQQPAHPARASMTNVNIVITCVAWSMPQVKSEGEEVALKEEDQNTVVAAAGSNGVVVIWNARQAFFSQTSGGGSSTMAHQQPEATLSQHTRAVNSLAWHPKRPGLLLTASQDATVKLWERRAINQQSDQEQNKTVRSWFGNMTSARSQPDRAYSWFCRATFEPKSEAVRDMQWSKFQDDVFALVTVSGSLIVYSMHVSSRAMVKIAAHTGDATSLDWHPTKPYVIATGGAGDRCVKVWDLESSINMEKRDDSNIALNANTLNTVRSDVSTNSYSSSETDRSVPSSVGSVGGTSVPIGTRGFSGSGHGVSRHKTSSAITLHVLSISASVTKLRWRPPALDTFASDDDGVVDRHDSMLAVATARLTSAGGSGVLSLWTFHRPFMPLSVVEGHEEGAVTDFVWLDTPQLNKKAEAEPKSKSNASSSKNGPKYTRRGQPKSAGANDTGEAVVLRSSGRDADSLFDSKEKETEKKEPSAVHVWQHVLSVGRDGRCLLQSFARGDRPISRVPSSCFSMANLSPFFANSGSLQFFSVYQNVPRGAKNDFLLTGLRQDEYTKRAPGVFKEMPAGDSESDSDKAGTQWAAGKRLPATVPDFVFNVVDQGDLDENGLPLGTNDKSIAVAPEVLHLSRFANLYKLYPDNRLPTRVDLCLHNGNVAEDLRCGPLARMWRSVASMLNGSGMDGLPLKGASSQPMNVMQFALLPTIKSLLEERADAGDVQSCVAVCEVLQVIQPDQQIRIPGLELNLVREWYLSYIDLLQQMCLFSSASLLIRSCNDPFIGALNQQSTTIHESCPRCGKPLQPSTDGAGSTLSTSARRACKNCRRRVGLCFLCHEPVKGMFVWCPGCGHGGHLDHALQWFGGLSGKPVREVCPTGCGHKCNLSQMLSAFPRTDSLMCLPTQMEGISTALK